MKLSAKFDDVDLVYALDCAAEFLENEEWPEPDEAERVCAANREAAKRIRKIADRIMKKQPLNKT